MTSQAAGRCASRPDVPAVRGPLTAELLRLLDLPSTGGVPRAEGAGDPLVGDDFHLALYLCYELSYRGLPGVDPERESDLAVVSFRRRLEQAFEGALRSVCTARSIDGDAPAAVGRLLERPLAPSLSSFLAVEGSRDQLLEFLVHRSAYQLKEADPHSWVIPRLVPGRRKAALIEIQTDEYGNGVPGQSHAELFADAMAAAGLSARYGAYLDALPGATLATVNLVSLFGHHRRLAGALLGHLATFEMTSVEPMGRYAWAATRLGLGPVVRRFYDVHVEADEHHGELAERVLIGGDLRRDGLDPDEVVFGAEALARVEATFTRHLLAAWAAGRSSLLVPRADTPGAPGAPVERQHALAG